MTSLFSCRLVYCSLGYVLPRRFWIKTSSCFRTFWFKLISSATCLSVNAFCVSKSLSKLCGFSFGLCIIANPHAPMKGFPLSNLTCMKVEYELVITLYIRNQNQNLKLGNSKNRRWITNFVSGFAVRNLLNTRPFQVLSRHRTRILQNPSWKWF